MTFIEEEINTAFEQYKYSLIQTNYRSLGHKISCLFGIRSALDADEALAIASVKIIQIMNKSPEHQNYVHSVAKQMLENLQKKDNFLGILAMQQPAN